MSEGSTFVGVAGGFTLFEVQGFRIGRAVHRFRNPDGTPMYRLRRFPTLESTSVITEEKGELTFERAVPLEVK